MKTPIVFLAADVIFAGASSPTEHGASHVVLRLGEITLIECVTSTQAITEVERNFADKLPSMLPELQLIISRSLRIVPDPEPDDLAAYAGQANPKDLPILVVALKEVIVSGVVFIGTTPFNRGDMTGHLKKGGSFGHPAGRV